MCKTCSASWHYIRAIENWVVDGGPCKKNVCISASTAISAPNTLVYIFEDRLSYNGQTRSIYFDVH